MLNKYCGNCEWFDGDIESGYDFCNEHEEYVTSDGYCSKYRKRYIEQCEED